MGITTRDIHERDMALRAIGSVRRAEEELDELARLGRLRAQRESRGREVDGRHHAGLRDIWLALAKAEDALLREFPEYEYSDAELRTAGRDGRGA